MDLDQYQAFARRTKFFKVKARGRARKAELSRHYLIAGLTAQVGEIASRLKKKIRDGDDYELLGDEVAERIGYALWYLALFADEFGISLSTVAKQNVAFNERRWRQHMEEKLLFDDKDFDSKYPKREQLPSKMMVEFCSEELEGIKTTTVWMYPQWPKISGRQRFGDPIDDNSSIEDHYRFHDVFHFSYIAMLSWSIEDHYRFHDVFHFSYIAMLSWSPVVRGLLRKKRKSNPDIDRIEDGARAIDTEEAVTAFIYSYVHQQNYLATSSNIDTGVLTTVRTLLRAYEVRACAEKDWERAIVQAAAVLRKLIKNNGGWVRVDRKSRKIRYLDVPPRALSSK